MNGGAGADTLSGGTGNDTLTGGKGNDVFVHVADTDFITDYAAGQDKIKLTEGKIVGLSISNSNLVMDVGAYGSITVKNGVDKKITVIDANDTETVIIGTTYDDTAAAKVTLASGVVIGDATARTSGTKIVGNALDNTILSGSGKDSLYGNTGDDYLVGNAGADKLYGQNDDDTLWGGIGNDTLKGGAGADTFIYNNGEGKDVITDFGDDDLLQITGTFTGTYNASANAIAFKVGSTASALTLKNFTATTFNINGDAWRIKNGAFVKK